MANKEFYEPDVLDVHLIENMMSELNLASNLGNKQLSDYMQGISFDDLYKDTNITQSNIIFKGTVSPAIKKEIVELLNAFKNALNQE